jgi:glycosyltransferase involved in cell wall biosynthesis
MAPFVYEQANALKRLGVECGFILADRGLAGYMRTVKKVRKAIQSFSPDVVHAHYGLCGVIANIQRKVPVITTFHGSDLNDPAVRRLSSLAILLSKASIVVSEPLYERARIKRNMHVIPCGIDTGLLAPMDRTEARLNLGWKMDGKYILFSKEFFNKAKNYPLAKASVDCYNNRHPDELPAELLEFIGYSREQVRWLYSAVDCVLMTSDNEGSPQFIKEAMSCNCPIVSVDVGDVKHVIAGTDGCYLAERDQEDIADKLEAAILHGRTNGRQKVLQEYGSEVIARKVLDLYQKVSSHE